MVQSLNHGVRPLASVCALPSSDHFVADPLRGYPGSVTTIFSIATADASVMNVLAAPNAFKGALSAVEAAKALARGIRSAAPRARLDLMPISDGGDGLMEVLLNRWGGRRVARTVLGPLGRPCRAFFALSPDGKTAVVEMAQASGIARLKPRERDPLHATSYGTGELISAALESGASRIVVGLGGSATNDGGAGLAAALGAKLLDAGGRVLPFGAGPLERLRRVEIRGLHPRLSRARVIAVSDVTNPLLGPLGSARVFGPQKGATPSQVRVIERALARYAAVLRRDLGADVSRVPGGGAAGGLGAGLAAFLRARLVPGARWVLSELGAEERIARADLVLTGEGKLDSQSFFGKAPVELARLARRKGVPVAFFCGQMERGLAAELEGLGSPEICLLSDPAEDPDDAAKETARRLERCAADVARRFS